MLKRTSFVLALFAALMPFAASAQIQAPPVTVVAPKYEIYAGAAYSRIKQVPLTYSGLIGGKVSVARSYGKYFQVFASGDYYNVGTGRAGLSNKGNPSIYSFTVGPQLHCDLFSNLAGLVFAGVGAEHTGGENMSPSISFAGTIGGGLEYRLSPRWAVRLTGDRMGASFPLPNTNPLLAYSTHRTWNARGTIGAVYRF